MSKIRLEQHGFKSNHSTSTQFLNLINELVANTNKRTFTAVVSLGVKKAFDKVWHEGLIYKLVEMKIPTQLVNFIKSFLTSRTFQTKTNNYLQYSKQISEGVPHGSCLFPHLFTIYINDMIQFPNQKSFYLQATHYFSHYFRKYKL